MSHYDDRTRGIVGQWLFALTAKRLWVQIAVRLIKMQVGPDGFWMQELGRVVDELARDGDINQLDQQRYWQAVKRDRGEGGQ